MNTTEQNKNDSEIQRIRKDLGDFYPYANHFKTVHGRQMHYIDEGQGPVILMIHGNPSWSIYWRKIVELLKANYRVIAVDHIGCGFSEKPEDYSYTLNQRIEDVWSLVQQLGISQYSLLVHDWGGAIGMGLAEKAPEQIKSIVVFNSAAFFSANIPKRIALCRLPIFGKVAIQGFNGFAKAAVHMATHKGFSKSLRKAYIAPYDSFKNRRATYEFVQDIPMEIAHPTRVTIDEIEKGLPLFKKHPILLIWGEKDWCFDMSYLQTWREKFPQAEVLSLKSSGHYVVEDGFEDYKAQLTQFLGKNS